jgi:hypothetical protein
MPDPGLPIAVARVVVSEPCGHGASGWSTRTRRPSRLPARPPVNVWPPTLTASWLTSSDPTGRTAWKLVRLDRSGRRLGSASLSCASATQCVVVFGDGRVFSTTHLTAGAPRWDQTQLRSSRLPDRPVTVSVSCTTANVCAAVADGSVWASAAPGRSGPRRWRRVATDAGTAAAGDVLTSVACVAGQLCVAVDRAGHVLSSRAITQPGSWRRQTIADPSQSG